MKSIPLRSESLTCPGTGDGKFSVERRTRADQDKLGTALHRMTLEDPSLRLATNAESGQTLLRGTWANCISMSYWTGWRTDYGVDAVTGRPAVAYRETLLGSAEAECRYVRQSGGPGQFGHVVIAVAPGARESDLVFVDETHGGVVPREFVPAVEKGIRGAMSRGVLAGISGRRRTRAAPARELSPNRLERDGVRDRRLSGVSSGPPSKRALDFSGAHHGRRGSLPRGVRG